MHLGPFPIRWYALAYIFGLLIGWWYASRIASRPQLWGETEKSPVTKADIDDFAFWAMIGILIGGRIGYILFYTLPYEPEKLSQDPMFIFKMWEGGMSFHGGLIGVDRSRCSTHHGRGRSPSCASAMLRAPQRRSASASGASPTSSTANSTAARPTVPWAMRFPTYDWGAREWVFNGTEKLVHPSQLYEAALEGVLLFVVLAVAVWKFKALKRPGLVSGIFLVGYAVCRTFVENFREPDSFVEGLPVVPDHGHAAVDPDDRRRRMADLAGAERSAGCDARVSTFAHA